MRVRCRAEGSGFFLVVSLTIMALQWPLGTEEAGSLRLRSRRQQKMNGPKPWESEVSAAGAPAGCGVPIRLLGGGPSLGFHESFTTVNLGGFRTGF